MDMASGTVEASPRAKIIFHSEAYGLWMKGLSHRAIAAQLGIKTARVSAWSAREKWTQRLQEIGRRLARKAMRQAVESLEETKRRHARVARRGLARVESKLMSPVLDPQDLNHLASATERFATLEEVRHPDYVAEPTRVQFPELVSILEGVWASRLQARQMNALPEATVDSGDGTNGQRALPLPIEAYPKGVDPREAYCAEREAAGET